MYAKIGVVAAVLASWVPAASGSTNYEVLERSGSLVGVSTAGASVGTITNSFGGIDLAVDAGGNYIITTGSHLMRVTPAGDVSTIAVAAYGSQFLSVAIDAAGNFIIVDNELHRVLRLTPDGQSRTVVATYPVTSYNELEDALVRIDSSGNYIVIEDNNFKVDIFKITPSGALTTVLASQGGVPAREGSGLTFDSAGNYVIADYSSNSLWRISPSGTYSLITTNPSLANPIEILRDPSTGDFLVTAQKSGSLLDVSPDGSTVRTLYSGLANPTGVVIAPVGGSTTPVQPNTVLFDVSQASQSTSLGDIAGNPTTVSIQDNSNQPHTYHTFVIEDAADSNGSPMGLNHSTFRLALLADGNGSVLSVTMPTGGDSTDINSGGALQVVIPFGVNVLSIGGTNLNLGTPGSPIAGAFSCAFGAVRDQALGAAFGSAYTGFQVPECAANLLPPQSGDLCSLSYPVVNSYSAACLSSLQTNSLYGDKVLNNYQIRNLLWKPTFDGMTNSTITLVLDQTASQVYQLIRQKGITVYLNTPRGDLWLDNFH